MAAAFTCYETCNEDGTWGRCNGWSEVEPECGGIGDDYLAAQCSSYLLSVVASMSATADEHECRSAFAVWYECTAGTCAAPLSCSPSECTATVQAMDLACMGMSAPCTP